MHEERKRERGEVGAEEGGQKNEVLFFANVFGVCAENGRMDRVFVRTRIFLPSTYGVSYQMFMVLFSYLIKNTS